MSDLESHSEQGSSLFPALKRYRKKLYSEILRGGSQGRNSYRDTPPGQNASYHYLMQISLEKEVTLSTKERQKRLEQLEEQRQKEGRGFDGEPDLRAIPKTEWQLLTRETLLEE